MQKSFLFNITLLLGTNLLIKPFYIFGIDRGVQNAVGPDSYGLYFALFNFVYLFQLVNDFGIQNFNSRNISQNRQVIPKHFPSILALKTGLSLLFLAMIFIGAKVSGYEGPVYHLLLIIGLTQIASSFSLFIRSNISGLGHYTADSLLSVLDKVVMILVCSYLLWFSDHKESFQIEWFAYAQLASFCIAALCAFLYLKGKMSRFQLSKKRSFYIALIKQSIPFALVLLLMTVYTRIDAVMIERMLPDGAKEAGIYAAGYRILDASNMLGFLAASLLLPMFARMLKLKEKIEPLMMLGFQLVYVLIFAVAINAFFFQQEIMELLYIEGNAYYGRVFGLLILGSIAINVNYIFGTLLTANANMKALNILFACSVVLNIILNYFLISSYKAYGAATATLITQGIVTLIEIILCVRIFKVKMDVKKFLLIILFSLISVLISYLFGQIFDWPWVIAFVSSIFISIILAFLLKLIDLSSISMLLKEKAKIQQ